jgi:AcrR family transcriptional regulator
VVEPTGSAAPDAGRRPIGRPRNTGSAPSGSPREAIIAVATRLFAEKGYAKTTMSDVARAAGLQHSSLYYWFRRKELILQATLALNRAPLDFISKMGAGSGSPALKLYRLLRYDTRQLCVSPCDFNEVERLAELEPDILVDFWRDYQQLHRWVVTLIQVATDEGQFIECDADVVGTGLLCFNEGVQKRYRYQSQHGADSDSPFVHRSCSADEFAELVASMSVRSLLRDPVGLSTIQKEAALCKDW